MGSAGTGKTHLGIALGIAACRAGKRVRFCTAAGLVVRSWDLVVLDELGYIPFSAGLHLVIKVTDARGQLSVRGESGSCDLKTSFDPASSRAKVELVKDLVAFANAGGGQIMFGYAETGVIGVPRSLLRDLDGARLTDLVNRYVAPGTVHVSHAVEELHSDDRVGIIVTVAPYGKYPLVFNREGDHSEGATPVFRKGDVYIRHGAKSERVNFQDIVWFIDKAVESSRGELMRRIDQLARLPEGYRIRFVPPSGEELDEPNNLLATVSARRSRDPSVMLSGRDLLWCWKNRRQLELTDTNVDLLIRSALRRTPTLFLWLVSVIDRPELIGGVLVSTLEDPDRDKSDAARALLEVGALVASERDLDRLVEGLRTSRYAHFREAVKDWPGRSEFVKRMVARGRAVKWDGQLLADLDSITLLTLANDLTTALLEDGKSAAVSRALSDVGRSLFLRAEGRFPEPGN